MLPRRHGVWARFLAWDPEAALATLSVILEGTTLPHFLASLIVVDGRWYLETQAPAGIQVLFVLPAASQRLWLQEPTGKLDGANLALPCVAKGPTVSALHLGVAKVISEIHRENWGPLNPLTQSSSNNFFLLRGLLLQCVWKHQPWKQKAYRRGAWEWIVSPLSGKGEILLRRRNCHYFLASLKAYEPGCGILA